MRSQSDRDPLAMLAFPLLALACCIGLPLLLFAGAAGLLWLVGAGAPLIAAVVLGGLIVRGWRH